MSLYLQLYQLHLLNAFAILIFETGGFVGEVVESASAEPVGHLQGPSDVTQQDRHGNQRLPSKCEDLLMTVGKILNSKSLHIAMFFMLLDWVSIKSEESEHRVMESTVVDISIPPPSFKLVPLSSPRFPLF